MLDELRQLGTVGEIANWVESPPSELSTETVHGVALDIDDYWLSYWQSYKGLMTFAGTQPILNVYIQPEAKLGRTFRTNFNARYDFLDRPKDWRDYCDSRGYQEDAHPVRVIIVLREKISSSLMHEYSHIGRHPIVYEVRPPALAHSLKSSDYVARSTVSTNKHGTVGGLLYDNSNGSYHLVTCAHVMLTDQTGDRVISPRPTLLGTPTEIGTVTLNHYPQPSPGAKCNNKIAAVVPKLDAALVKVDTSVSVDVSGGAGKISKVSPIAELGRDDPVEFHGAKSGRVKARIAEVNIWHEIEVVGTKVCFSDLFAIQPRGTVWVNSSLSVPGDSGSWVVSRDGGIVRWDGMLLAGDGSKSYCCYAEHVFDEFRKDNRYLVLPP